MISWPEHHNNGTMLCLRKLCTTYMLSELSLMPAVKKSKYCRVVGDGASGYLDD
jgi:hypothetical protein